MIASRLDILFVVKNTRRSHDVQKLFHSSGLATHGNEEGVSEHAIVPSRGEGSQQPVGKSFSAYGMWGMTIFFTQQGSRKVPNIIQVYALQHERVRPEQVKSARYFEDLSDDNDTGARCPLFVVFFHVYHRYRMDIRC